MFTVHMHVCVAIVVKGVWMVIVNSQKCYERLGFGKGWCALDSSLILGDTVGYCGWAEEASRNTCNGRVHIRLIL